jgi:hypothetical protein
VRERPERGPAWPRCAFGGSADQLVDALHVPLGFLIHGADVLSANCKYQPMEQINQIVRP